MRTHLLTLCPFLLAATASAQTLNPANGHYYEYVSATVTWTEARDAAASSTFMGVQGHLATISDPAENAFVRSVDQSAVGGWLGAYQDTSSSSYSEPSGGWTWVTGEPVAYFDWRTSTGEPNNGFGSGENVLEMVDDGQWNDVSEPASMWNPGYVIEYDVFRQYAGNSNWYGVIDANLCWDDARDAAAAMTLGGVPGHLVTITSAGERDFVDALMPPGANRWLGGYQDTSAPDYAEPGGGWRWVTGEAFVFADWASAEPSNANGGEEYLELYGSFYAGDGWNDNGLCSTINSGYIVEFESDLGPVHCTSQPNSTGARGQLIAVGSVVAAENDLTLHGFDLPPAQFTMLVTSVTPDVFPVGNGVLCLGGPIGRFNQPGQIQATSALGRIVLPVDTQMVPNSFLLVPILSGETHYFQAWHRDVGGAGFNFTDGLQLTFY